MTEIPSDRKYTEEHEWVKMDGNKAIIGITDYAQTKLTDIVYVEFGESGREVKKGDELGTVESVKTVSEIYAPISGTVEEFNTQLEDSPQLMNEDPYGIGWFAKVKVATPSEVDSLLDSGSYSKHTED